jgi:hypothetical protein
MLFMENDFKVDVTLGPDVIMVCKLHFYLFEA